ncbi:MAG TPA: serine hydrolase [Blastocatellia bacterium]|nr:serine hydrolase [Blastocatellia bacterium]
MKPFHQCALRILISVFALGAGISSPSTSAQSVATVDATTRAEIIEGALKALNDEYVFPETASKMEQAIRERMRRREYDNITSPSALATTLTSHLQEISKDKHLRVIFDDGSRPMFGGGPNQAERERARMMSAKRNFGFEKVERLISDQALANQMKSMIEALQSEIGEITLPASTRPAAQPASAVVQQPSKPSSKEIGGDAIKLPDTPAGKTLGEFIKAFNTGDLETLRRFHKERGGDEENAWQDIGFYQQSGGLTLHSITRSDQFEIEVLVQTKKEERWMSFSMGVEPQAPHGIADIRVKPASAPGEKIGERGISPEPSKETLSEAGIMEHLNAMLDKRVAEDSFSGVVMVARDGKPIFQRAVGLASKSYNVPNRIDTKFNLGSINKFFTRIAITQLIEQGKLSLDDAIGKHLPDYPNKEAAEKVTIKHLLDMQSGIGDFFGSKFDATPKNRIRSINDYLPLFADQTLKFEPGTSRAYSNGGYIALGAIIEKVTGQSYYNYVRERIFKPVGMANTDSYEVDEVTPNLATGYTRGANGVRVSNVYTKPARGSSAGGGYSTAEDLLKFTIALRTNKLLSEAQTKRTLQGGLGIAGGAPGINAELEIDPGSGYTVIVLSNYDPPSAANVSQQIRKWIAQIEK